MSLPSANFGQRPVLQEHGPAVVVNAKLGHGLVANRKLQVKNGNGKVLPIAGPDHMQFSVAGDELLFAPITETDPTPSTFSQVIATTDGVDPAKFDKEYYFAGLAMVGASWEPKRDADISLKIEGVTQQRNTGKRPILAGDLVEYYAMDKKEADAFHLAYNTTRTQPGVRKHTSLSFKRQLRKFKPQIQNAMNDDNKLGALLHGLFARSRQRVFMKAHTNADVGGFFTGTLVHG